MILYLKIKEEEEQDGECKEFVFNEIEELSVNKKNLSKFYINNSKLKEKEIQLSKLIKINDVKKEKLESFLNDEHVSLLLDQELHNKKQKIIDREMLLKEKNTLVTKLRLLRKERKNKHLFDTSNDDTNTFKLN